MMRICKCKMSGFRIAAVLAVIALSLSSCSGKDPSRPPDGPGPSFDAGRDAQIDANVDADPSPTAACERDQRDYVNKQLAPELQTDVTATVSAVLRAADFPRAMPFCSGDRPIGSSSPARAP